VKAHREHDLVDVAGRYVVLAARDPPDELVVRQARDGRREARSGAAVVVDPATQRGDVVIDQGRFTFV